MGTIVTIDVPRHATVLPHASGAIEELVERAFGWFHEIERRCSRFDPDSELTRLTRRVGVATEVSPLLLDVLRFAVAVADETDGAFDPTVGAGMERRGFDIEHRTRHRITSARGAHADATYRNIEIDSDAGTVTLTKRLVLDLGAIAKGLAIDLAARELAPLEHFAIDAGGDLYLGGTRADGRPWSVGIRHPIADDVLLESVEATNQSVCTSGNYERRSETEPAAGHIVDARSGAPCDAVASATVISASAMLADALATAAFVLGPEQGAALLTRHGVDGVLFAADLTRIATGNLRRTEHD